MVAFGEIKVGDLEIAAPWAAPSFKALPASRAQ